MGKMSMSINTDSHKLTNRISTHKKYSLKDINKWIFNKVAPLEGENLLDIGCGTGEQLIKLSKKLGNKSTIFGIDASSESLKIINDKCKNFGISNVTTIKGNMDEIDNLLLHDDFDIIISCFALYYSKNIPKLIANLKTKLKKDGRFFVCGPMKGNNVELMEFQSKISSTIPKKINYPMTETILPELQKNFQAISKIYFENPIKFPNSSSLIEYWKSYILYDPTIENKFREQIKNYFDIKTEFITTKRVIGIHAKM